MYMAMPILVVMAGLICLPPGDLLHQGPQGVWVPRAPSDIPPSSSGVILIVFTYIIGAALGLPTGVFWAVTSGLVVGVIDRPPG